MSLWETVKNNRPKAKDYSENTEEKMKKLPKKVDLRKLLKNIPVYDQGGLGSSTACAVATAFAVEQQKKK